jgi:hypothetical protein
VEHISSIQHFDGKALVSLCKISPSILQHWLGMQADVAKLGPFSTKVIDRFSSLANRFRDSKNPLSQLVGRSFAQVINNFFKRRWGPRFETRSGLQPLALATLCTMMCAQRPQTLSCLARLLDQDFIGFGAAILVLHPYISTIPVLKFQSEAFGRVC